MAIGALLKVEVSKGMGLGCNEGMRMEKKQGEEENVRKDEEDSETKQG